MLTEPFEAIVSLPDNLLPAGFVYPTGFIEFVQTAGAATVLDGEPWTLLSKRSVARIVANVRQQNPHLVLVPFALRQYTNHVACFEGQCTTGAPKVAVMRIHDSTEDGGVDGYIHPDYDVPGWLQDVSSWLALVTDDSADFKRVHHGG